MYKCEIVLDSIAPSGGRLTTMEITFPRIVLAEFNTHRMLSRNSASSRAVPTQKMLDRASYTPSVWGANQKGMQAGDEVDDNARIMAELRWDGLRSDAQYTARVLADLGIHKQIANRPLEPFLWHTVIVSATEWDNFFTLRDHKDADPAIQQIAALMRENYEKSTPQSRMWHTPYSETFDFMVSAGRCARVSVMQHDGTTSEEADRALAERLLVPRHMSPFEHQAYALDSREWGKYAREMAEDWIVNRKPVGNFWGWLQHRKIYE